MTNIRTSVLTLALTVAVLGMGGWNLAQAGSCSVGQTAASGEKKTGDIVDVAANAGQFKTLLAGAKAAGLVEALKGDGPLTVFAPTDDAFAKLPAGTVENLLKPENKEQLKAILLYHVASGKLTAEQVVKQTAITTLQGQSLTVKVADGKVYVDNARVTATDVNASNGVIHIVDTVILPKG